MELLTFVIFGRHVWTFDALDWKAFDSLNFREQATPFTFLSPLIADN